MRLGEEVDLGIPPSVVQWPDNDDSEEREMSTQWNISIEITDRKSSIVDDDFMEATFDQSTSDMFKLLSSLHDKNIPRRDFDSNALGGIPSPDFQTWITRTTVDGQKIDIWMTSC